MIWGVELYAPDQPDVAIPVPCVLLGCVNAFARRIGHKEDGEQCLFGQWGHSQGRCIRIGQANEVQR